MKELMSKAGGFALPKANDLMEGKILKITKSEVLVALGSFGTGIIYGAELKESKEMIKDLKEGDKISALVVEPENEDGYVELSLKEASLEKTWNELKEWKQNNETVTVKIVEANRGGLVVKLSSIIGFLPVSQLSPENYPRVEGGDKNKILRHLNQFVGQEMQVKIISLDKEADKLIVSEKALQEKQIKEDLSKYQKGDVVEGTVSAIVDFGAFIKFGNNLEGLAHISELAWQIIDHPSQVVKEKEKIKAQIIDIQDNQVSLSLRALKSDPWENIAPKLQNGQVVEGKVIKFNPSGAFVRVDEGVHGLIHQSEFNNREKDMQEVLALGENYNFKILSISPENHKMSLGLNQTNN